MKEKFKDINDQYLNKRNQFAKKIGSDNLFQYIDQFPLYAGKNTIGSKLFTYEVLKMVQDVPGHIAEFGTWHGANLMFMAKTLQLLQPNSHKKIIGFDNFSGLPEATNIDGEYAHNQVGNYHGSLEILKAAIDLYEFENTIELVIGDACQTIVEFEKKRPEVMISLAYIDFDLYEPCKVALEFIAKRLAVGGAIVFDEAISELWPGETKAMFEFLDQFNGSFRMVANHLTPQPTLCLIREK